MAGPVEALARARDFLFLAPDCYWETDADGRFTEVSKGLLGWTVDEMTGRRVYEVGLAASDSANTPFHARDMVHERHWRAHDKAGRPRCLCVSALPVTDHDGRYLGARGVARDVTDIETRDAALANARMRDRIVGHIVRILRDDLAPERELAAAAKSLAVTLNAAGCLIYRRAREGWETVAHYGEPAPGSVVILSNAIMNRGNALKTASQGYEWLMCRTQVHREVNGALAVWRPTGERDWTQDEAHLIEAVADQLGMTWAQLARTEQLAEQAERDPLTGLLNQRAFTAQAAARLQRNRAGTGLYLLALDLDHFKTVNDHLGHPQGDEVLKRVAGALRQSIRDSDLAGRTGGDEFMVWLERAGGEAAESVAARILAELKIIADSLPELPHRLGVSIGIAPAGANDTLASLIHRADTTMYKAKHDGRNRAGMAT